MLMYPSLQASSIALDEDTVPIEVGIVGMITGAPAMEAFIENVRRCLPSVGKMMGTAKAIQAMASLRSSVRNRLAPAASQNLLSMAMGLMSALIDGAACAHQWKPIRRGSRTFL